MGHIATVCLSKAKQKSLRPKSLGKAKQEKKAHYVQMREEDRESDQSNYIFFTMSDSNRSAPLVVTVRANLADLEVEVNTGATLSLVSETTHQ